tara:strand:+ start:868 stop:1110 length:243 start_codon:yes stop_codon:yes gene_type:complete
MLNLKKIIKIVAKSIKVKEKNISLTSKMGDFEDWDSLGHLKILSEIDKITKGKASLIGNLAQQNSVSNIYKVLKKNKLSK